MQNINRMRPFVISCLAAYLISCNPSPSLEHKTYGDYSLGITKDSLDKLSHRLYEQGLQFSSTVRRDGIILSYIVSKQDDGRYFNLYPSINTKAGLVSETFFYISHYTSNTVDDIRDARPNKITNYPLLSRQEAIDEGKSVLGYEDIRTLIEQKLKENYGSMVVSDSVSIHDFDGTAVNEITYKWKDIDGLMDIDFVIRQTDKHCVNCNPLLPIKPEDQKFYSRAEMFLTYYLNKSNYDKLKSNPKNDF